MLGFFEYLLLNSNVQSSMKWPKKIEQQIFLIFKMDLVTNKIFQCFYIM